MIALPPGRTGGNRRGGVIPAMSAVVLLVAVALAASPLSDGDYDFGLWAPLELGAMVLLIVVSWSERPGLNRRTAWVAGGLVGLLALSALSLTWAQSKESAWTDTNRLALYVTIFLIAVFAIRDRRTARLVVLVLGLAALLTSVWLPVDFLFGGGAGDFLGRRLNSPIGYINGTAGLLVMGVWPWLGFAQNAATERRRAVALGAATLIAATFLMTESRAVIPATVLTAVLVIACAPGRTHRAANLLLMGLGVLVTAHWTLHVYSSGGLAARYDAPAQGLLRAAGIAVLLAGAFVTVLSLLAQRGLGRLTAERRARIADRVGRVLLGITVVGVICGLAFGHSWISRQYHTFTSDKVDAAASVRFIDASGFRYDLWRVAVKEFGAHPIVGVGAGNYDTDYYRLRHNPEYVVQPHSIELQMMAELGILGLIALLVVCGVVLGSGFVRKGTLAAQDPVIRIGALGIFAAWLIDTSVDWLYDIPGLTGMAMVAAALLVLPAPGTKAVLKRNRGYQIGLITGLIALALLAASVGRQYVASRYAASGSAKIARSPQSALPTLRTAARLDPYNLQTLYSLASAYARLDDYDEARAALLIAAQKEPSNYVPPALLGDLADRRGDERVALADYEKAQQLNPQDPGVAQSLAQVKRELQ